MQKSGKKEEEISFEGKKQARELARGKPGFERRILMPNLHVPQLTLFDPCLAA